MICCGINPNDVIDNSSRRQTPAVPARPNENNQIQAQNNESFTDIVSENRNSRSNLQIEPIPESNKNNELNAAGASKENKPSPSNSNKVFKNSDIMSNVKNTLLSKDDNLSLVQMNTNGTRKSEITTFIENYTDKIINSISEKNSQAKNNADQVLTNLSNFKNVLNICDLSEIDKAKQKEKLEVEIGTWLNSTPKEGIYFTENDEISNIANYISKCKNEALKKHFLESINDGERTLFQFKINQDYNDTKRTYSCHPLSDDRFADKDVYVAPDSFIEMVKIDPGLEKPIVQRILRESISKINIKDSNDEVSNFLLENNKDLILFLVYAMLIAKYPQENLIDLSINLLENIGLNVNDITIIANYLIQFERYNDMESTINSKINELDSKTQKDIRNDIAFKFVELEKFDEAKKYLVDNLIKNEDKINLYKVLIEKNQLTDTQEINDFIGFAIDERKHELVEELIESLKKQNKEIDDLKIELLLAIKGHYSDEEYEMMLIKLIDTEELKNALLNHQNIENENENEKNKINYLFSLAAEEWNQRSINNKKLHIKEGLINRYISDQKYNDALNLIKFIGKGNHEEKFLFSYYAKLLEKLDSNEDENHITNILNEIDKLYGTLDLNIYNNVVLEHLVKQKKVETLEHIFVKLNNVQDKITFLKEISKF